MYAISVTNALLISIRPKQWTKNLIVYFAFLFTVHQAWNPGDIGTVVSLFGKTTLAFLLFSLITGAVYLFNDVIDREKDSQHPRKRFRPIASGKLPIPIALLSASVLAFVSIVLSFLLQRNFGLVAVIYMVVMVSYTLILKKIALLDVMSISAGFVIRAAAGAVVINVPISPWLYVVTALGALFIALGKRRNELEVSGEHSSEQRDVLKEYSIQLLDHLIAVAAPATLLAYILYTFTAEGLPSNYAMMLTIPFVIYGLFRYLFLIYRKGMGENPEDIVLTDGPLIADVVLWLASAAAILLLYRN